MGKPGFHSGSWGGEAIDEGPGSPGQFELLTVERMFGTSEFSAWSESLDAAVAAPLMSMNGKDAAGIGLSDGDTVSVELEGGAFKIVVSVSDRTAEGVLVIPRHNSLDWRKMKGTITRVSVQKIRKI